MLASYWPFAVGVGIFLGLVFIVMKLVRGKRETDILEPEEEEEKRPSGSTFTMEEDSGPRWWQQGIKLGVVVPILVSVIAVLIALFSGPSEKEIVLVWEEVGKVRGQLAEKAADSTVQQMGTDISKLKSDIGKVREDADANTASLTVLAGRADISNQKIANLQVGLKKTNIQVGNLARDARFISRDVLDLKKAKSTQDSINAAQDTVLAALINKVGLTPTELEHLRRGLERPVVP